MRLAKAVGLAVIIAGGMMASPRPADALTLGWFCFFDRGDSLPNADCQKAVQQVATWWLTWGGASTCPDRPPSAPHAAFIPSRVLVAGYGDRAEESARIADRVARQRAEVIAALLRANCVPAEKILVESWGGTRNLVPTRSGVDEPKNRRVEIIPRS